MRSRAELTALVHSICHNLVRLCDRPAILLLFVVHSIKLKSEVCYFKVLNTLFLSVLITSEEMRKRYELEQKRPI